MDWQFYKLRSQRRNDDPAHIQERRRRKFARLECRSAVLPYQLLNGLPSCLPHDIQALNRKQIWESSTYSNGKKLPRSITKTQSDSWNIVRQDDVLDAAAQFRVVRRNSDERVSGVGAGAPVVVVTNDLAESHRRLLVGATEHLRAELEKEKELYGEGYKGPVYPSRLVDTIDLEETDSGDDTEEDEEVEEIDAELEELYRVSGVGEVGERRYIENVDRDAGASEVAVVDLRQGSEANLAHPQVASPEVSTVVSIGELAEDSTVRDSDTSPVHKARKMNPPGRSTISLAATTDEDDDDDDDDNAARIVNINDRELVYVEDPSIPGIGNWQPRLDAADRTAPVEERSDAPPRSSGPKSTSVAVSTTGRVTKMRQIEKSSRSFNFAPTSVSSIVSEKARPPPHPSTLLRWDNSTTLRSLRSDSDYMRDDRKLVWHLSALACLNGDGVLEAREAYEVRHAVQVELTRQRASMDGCYLPEVTDRACREAKSRGVLGPPDELIKLWNDASNNVVTSGISGR